ncbi:hypothetical protein DY000_02003399 [Brassica cretica]|uniref:Uncharacterized protein n=1 Tax=Brassica cretica TaxID=69181 RepID=A0ABQ7C9G0_BRACR|nr:hypothetical protein DY000_02003399 [Brassica cretica]
MSLKGPDHIARIRAQGGGVRGRGNRATRGKDFGATTEILKSTHYKGRGRKTKEQASKTLERATHLLRSCCLPILRFFLDRSHLYHSI